jgi:hypothetical protein
MIDYRNTRHGSVIEEFPGSRVRGWEESIKVFRILSLKVKSLRFIFRAKAIPCSVPMYLAVGAKKLVSIFHWNNANACFVTARARSTNVGNSRTLSSNVAGANLLTSEASLRLGQEFPGSNTLLGDKETFLNSFVSVLRRCETYNDVSHALELASSLGRLDPLC